MNDSDTEPGPQDEPDDGDDDDGGDNPYPTSLSTLNKKQLLEWCDENGVTGVSESMTKADILTYLTEHGYA